MNTTRAPLSPHAKPLRMSGFTLLEVMISLVILAIGVMGIIAMQMNTYKDIQTTHNFSRAAMLGADMADRMLANRDQANLNAYNHTAAPGTFTNCAAGACTALQLAGYDVAQWQAQVTGSLPSGSGSVSRVGGQLVIQVRWDDNRDGSTGTDCTALTGGIHDPVNDLDCYVLNLGATLI